MVLRHVVNKNYNVISLMSGTSLDGLDMSFCRIYNKDERWHYELRQTMHIAYNQKRQQALKAAIHLSGNELLLLHNDYGRWLGQQINKFIEKYTIVADMAASHGHTIFHQPAQGLTFQLGHGQAIATTCNLPVVADFRTLDLALNGQGAPLVPIGDVLFFSDYTFCLNIGGIANISFERQGQRIAFDIAPANMLFNHLAYKVGLAFDIDGKIAESGRLIPFLFDQLNQLLFYHQLPPKSLGYEWFVKYVLPLFVQLDAPLNDMMHTCVQHVALQIARVLLPIAEIGSRLLILVEEQNTNY